LAIQYEKITLTIALETYRPKNEYVPLSALDIIRPLPKEPLDSDVILIESDTTEYVLAKKQEWPTLKRSDAK